MHAWRVNVKRKTTHAAQCSWRTTLWENFFTGFQLSYFSHHKTNIYEKNWICVFSGKGGRCWIKLIWLIIIGFYDILNIIMYFTIISVQTHQFSMWMWKWMEEKIFTLNRLQKHPKAFQKSSMTLTMIFIQERCCQPPWMHISFQSSVCDFELTASLKNEHDQQCHRQFSFALIIIIVGL